MKNKCCIVHCTAKNFNIPHHHHMGLRDRGFNSRPCFCSFVTWDSRTKTGRENGRQLIPVSSGSKENDV